MNREQIKELAIANGFSLKPQPGGAHDLNPYVYEFAHALLEQSKAHVKWLEFQSMLSSADPAASRKTIAEHDAEVIERLRFPTMLRKMWSGTEVQQWLQEQADQLHHRAKKA